MAQQDQTDDAKRMRRDTDSEVVEQVCLEHIAENSETTTAAAASAKSCGSFSTAPISKGQGFRCEDASNVQTVTESRGFVASPGVVAALELAKARLEQRRIAQAAAATEAVEADP